MSERKPDEQEAQPEEAEAAAASAQDQEAALEAENWRKVKAVATALVHARKVYVFTGAGMSKESGIDTFRDPEMGLWRNKLAMALFGTPVGWRTMSGTAWRTYKKHFYDPIARAEPNDGHRVIAELPGALGVEVVVVTQNVDGLHQRAGTPDDHCLEVHGTVRRHRCIKCGRVSPVPAKEGDPFPSENPGCPHCHKGMRPDATLFGEDLPEYAYQRALREARSLRAGDVLMVVGTSAVVYPAAQLPQIAARRPGVFSVEFNPDNSEITHMMTEHISNTPTADVLRQVLNYAKMLKRAHDEGYNVDELEEPTEGKEPL